MIEKEDAASSSAASGNTSAEAAAKARMRETITAFDRKELSQIMRVYGRHVAEGEWRDYAIDHLKDRAIFSIFRRASEMPLFRIEKNPKLARKQGAFSVIAPGGMILKRGQDLNAVLRIFDKKRHLTVVS